MKMLYIENTIDEHNSKINGYFSTLKKAKEGLKDCCDWNRENGTGKIYLVDIDVLKAEPVLVCEDGKVARSYYSSVSIADLGVYSTIEEILLREGIRTLDDLIERGTIPAKVITRGPVCEEFKKALAEHSIYVTLPDERERPRPKELTVVVEDLISRATAISEQSKGLANGIVEDLLADATAKSEETVSNGKAGKAFERVME